MVKEALQKELKDKVKPGVKPSDLRSKLSSLQSKGDDLWKLKRSKSADDIPTTPSSLPLAKSKSSQPSTEIKYPYTTLISQQQELDRLQKETQTKSTTISLLRKKVEELEKNNPSNQLLQDQLTEKQKEIEGLRQQLETARTELNSLQKNHSNLLDDNLTLKHQRLKDWFKHYQQTKQLDQELAENIDEASNELLSQDKVIEKLRGENNKLKLNNQSLERDLQLTSRLAESRKVPYFANENNWDYLKYGLYSLVAVLFTVWLVKSFKNYE